MTNRGEKATTIQHSTAPHRDGLVYLVCYEAQHHKSVHCLRITLVNNDVSLGLCIGSHDLGFRHDI
jgi:hypothetical protein